LFADFFYFIYRVPAAQYHYISAQCIIVVSHYSGYHRRCCERENGEATNLSYGHTCLRTSRSHFTIKKFGGLYSHLVFLSLCLSYAFLKFFRARSLLHVRLSNVRGPTTNRIIFRVVYCAYRQQ